MFDDVAMSDISVIDISGNNYMPTMVSMVKCTYLIGLLIHIHVSYVSSGQLDLFMQYCFLMCVCVTASCKN